MRHPLRGLNQTGLRSPTAHLAAEPNVSGLGLVGSGEEVERPGELLGAQRHPCEMTGGQHTEGSPQCKAKFLGTEAVPGVVRL